jgi:transcription antitermination factor NusG
MRRYGLVPFVPIERKTTFASRYQFSAKRRLEQPMFPGLAFVQLAAPIAWHKILAIPFVHGVFSPYGEPYRFLARDVDVLRLLAGLPPTMPYETGDNVRFISGPLKSQPLVVASVDFARDECRVLADIMGRVTEIRARAGDVRKEVA